MWNIEQTQGAAEDTGKMVKLKDRHLACLPICIFGFKRRRAGGLSYEEDTLHSDEKSFALRAAGAIGDVITRERVAQLIKFFQAARFIVSRNDEGQRGVAELVKAGLNE